MKKLRQKKQLLRNLASSKTSVKKKRQLIQTGGFLGGILPIVISGLSSLLGGLFSS
jgi:hypothetical protein